MRDPRGLVPGEEAPDPAHPAFPRLRDAPERAPSQAAEKRRGVRGGDRGWRLTTRGREGIWGGRGDGTVPCLGGGGDYAVR